MEKLITAIASINDKVNSAVWGLPGLVLLIGTGILLTVCTKVFQISHVGHWWKNTIVTIFKKDSFFFLINQGIGGVQAHCIA